MNNPIPRWSLEQIYPGPESAAFSADLDVLKETIAEAERILEKSAPEDPVAWLRQVLPVYDRCTDLFENLESFAYASYSVDTGNTAAQQALSAVGVLSVPLSGMAVRFRSAVAALPGTVEELLAEAEDLSGYRFMLEETRLFQQRQLSPAEEGLAADLARSGADAWSRLHETVSSTLQATWNPETGETKSVVELRALAYDADRDRRRRAWQLERRWRSRSTA
jgi:oligoendopeptidase F